MKLNRSFAEPAEMPTTIPLFPLTGALLLPRRPIQLTVFEPRYLEMVDYALSGDRLLFLALQHAERDEPEPADLRPIGTIAAIRQNRLGTVALGGAFFAASAAVVGTILVTTAALVAALGEDELE